MAQLDLVSSGQKKSFPLEFEAVLLGSGSACHIQVQGKQIAPMHCRFVRMSGTYVAQDLSSGLGVMVNGQRVSRHSLQDGDVIQIGEFCFMFSNDKLRSTGRAPAKKTQSSRRITQKTAAVSRPGKDPKEDATGRAVSSNDSNKTNLYIGIGVGAVVLIALILVATSSGSSGGNSKDAAERELTRILTQVNEARSTGNHARALELLEEIVHESKFQACARYKGCQTMATEMQKIANLERDAGPAVAEFERKIEAAKADQTVLKRVSEFWDECLRLITLYGVTIPGKKLYDIKQDLERWRNNESESEWQNDYNRKKDRIATTHLKDGNYAQAINEWRAFGEISQSPLLHSRIELEIAAINKLASAEAEKLVEEVGTSDNARSKLESAQSRFNGTEGQSIITKKLRQLN